MAKNDNLTDFVTDIADTLRTALKQDSTHKINPQDFSGIITDIANGSTIVTEDITISPAETTQEVTRSEGKYINKVTVTPIQTETLNVTPTKSSQEIQAPQGKYYKEVNVGAVTSAIDSNITPTNIRAGVSILGVQGNLEPDKPNQTKTVDPSTETQVVVADTGYELESVTVNAVTSDIDSNIQPENIKKDVTILGVTGTVEEGGGKASPDYVSFSNYTGTSLDLSWLDTSNMTDMRSMFWACRELTSLDLSNFNTSKVITMENMLGYLSKITSLDVSNFDTSKVTTMSQMFYEDSNLTSLDLRNFNTENVTKMTSMFDRCKSLQSLDLSSFNTRNVTNMSSMFSNCNFTTLDLSSFNYSAVTNMSNMFSYMYYIKSIDIGYCSPASGANLSNMFYYVYSLKNITGTLDMQNVTNASSMFYYCRDLEEVHIHNLGVDLSLSEAPKLTHDCLVELINNLQTVTSTKTLTLGSTNLAKLTDEEKQVATNKGWTLA